MKKTMDMGPAGTIGLRFGSWNAAKNVVSILPNLGQIRNKITHNSYEKLSTFLPYEQHCEALEV